MKLISRFLLVMTLVAPLRIVDATSFRFNGRVKKIGAGSGLQTNRRLAACRLPINPALRNQLADAQKAPQQSDQAVVVVVGAGGTLEYERQFKQWAQAWQRSASHTYLSTIGLDENRTNSKTTLQKTIAAISKDDSIEELWLVMIGHGTFDGKRPKFNLRGPDIDDQELNNALSPVNQRIVVLNCTSSSSPFINTLSHKNRIIVTATRNAMEYNFARFGHYLSGAIDDPAADLDKDGQTSVLEAFCAASREVADFYQQENRIATEHALIDDNGDKKGTPANWFDGVRTTQKPKRGRADGLLANQVFLRRRGAEETLSAEMRKRRNELEAKLETIRLKKSSLDEPAYLLMIEPILLELAELYENAQK